MEQETKKFLSILSSFQHLFEDVSYYPNVVLTDLRSLSSSNKKIYPCNIIDLRKILTEEMIDRDKYVPLFSIKFSDKYLRKYPIFLFIDTKNIGVKKVDYDGATFYKSPLDIQNVLLSIIVNEPVDNIVADRIRKIIEESEVSTECISSNSIPGLSSMNPKLAKIAQGEPNINLNGIESKIFDFLNNVKNYFNLNTELRVAGGWVRDKLLGSPSDDIDIALEGMTGKQFVEYIKKYPKQKNVGKNYTVDMNAEKSKHLETAGIDIFGQKIEFVNLRSETYTTSRIPEMKMGDAVSDASRRDLTVNALFYNIGTKQVEDYVGGLSDLRDGVLRTPLDPVQTFEDDPLRILRSLRFASRFGDFELAPEIIEAMRNPQVQEAYKNKVSTERAGPEIMKLMVGENPIPSLRILFETDLYKSVFNIPEMEEIVSDGIQMDQKSSHHKYNLMNHTLNVVKNMNNIMKEKNESDQMRGLMNVAALFHDFGKMKPDIQSPSATDPNYMSYIHHEDASARMADDILKSIGVGKDDREIVNQVVKLHMIPHIYDKMSPKGKGRFLRKSRLPGKEEEHKDLWKYIFYHAQADEMSTIPEEFDIEKNQRRFNEFSEYVNSPKGSVQSSIVNGHDIMMMIPELKPTSGFIREVQERLQGMQDEGSLDMSFLTFPEGEEKEQLKQITIEKAKSKIMEMKPEIVNKYQENKMAKNWYKKVAQDLSSSDPEGSIDEFKDHEVVHGPKKCESPYRRGMKVRDRRRGVAFPQEYGIIRHVGDDKMKIEWMSSKGKKEQVYDLSDTVALSFLISEV